MQVLFEKTSSHATVRVVGRLDTNTAYELRQAMAGFDYKGLPLVLDFSELIYISSAGLREVLVLAKNSKENGLSVINASEAVYAVFETSGMLNIINVTKASRSNPSQFMNMSFKDFLSHQNQAHGAQVMLKSGSVSYTWEEAEQIAQIIAGDLAALGVGQGTHVGLCGMNSANWLFAFFAIQKLGAIAVLSNFNFKVAEVLQNCQVGDVTHFCYGEMPEIKDEESFVTEIKAGIGNVYSIRDKVDFKERLGEYPSLMGKFAKTIEPDAPCTMLFTSGSTGKPKGVLLSAYNILNASAVSAEILRIEPEDKICLILPLYHIFGLTAGLFSLFIGGGSVIIPENIKTNTLLNTIEQEKCTIFHSVPTMFLALVNNKSFEVARVASLRASIISGAATTTAQLQQLSEKFPNNHFNNAYGLSEMAPVSMCDYDDTAEHITTTIGKPVKNIEMKIQNMETKEDCPVGVEGEILVQGYNLMTCYYKADIDDQSIDVDGWLHTGDLGFLDHDGYLHLSGRLKELIIRGGENITPNEVAATISAQEGIADVKVLGAPHSFFGEEVVACLVLKHGFAYDEAVLRANVATLLAKFKQPSYYIVYDKFPLLPNGKVDVVNLKKDMLARLAEIKKEEAGR